MIWLNANIPIAEPNKPNAMAEMNAQRCSLSSGISKKPVEYNKPSAKGPTAINIPAVEVNGCRPLNLVFTICMLMPYNKVAKTTQSACTLKSMLKPCPAKSKPRQPIRPTRIPVICFHKKGWAKNRIPMISVKRGVKAFSIPDNALERCCPAMANKIAGIRLPVRPADKNESVYFFSMYLNRFKNIGIKKRLAEQIRSAPTCNAE